MADTFTQLPTQFTDPNSPYYDPSRFVSGGTMYYVDHRGHINEDIPRSQATFTEGEGSMKGGEVLDTYPRAQPQSAQPQFTGLLGWLASLFGMNGQPQQQSAQEQPDWRQILGRQRAGGAGQQPASAQGSFDSPKQYASDGDVTSLIKSLNENPSRLIGPDDDYKTANSITYTPKGTTVKLPSTQSRMQGAQTPLESMGSMNDNWRW